VALSILRAQGRDAQGERPKYQAESDAQHSSNSQSTDTNEIDAR
jgi:hypothetical protein